MEATTGVKPARQILTSARIVVYHALLGGSMGIPKTPEALERYRKGIEKGNRQSRQRALARYYENPRICGNCQRVIPVKDGERPAMTRRNRFCSLSCSASYNNKRKEYHKKIIPCPTCGKSMLLRPKGHIRKYCDTCVPLARLRQNKEGKPPKERTLEGVKAATSNPYFFRGIVNKYAREMYIRTGRPFSCFVCGYQTHVEICHIDPISKFPGITLLTVVNASRNLVALCRNHHWELDHKILDRQKIKDEIERIVGIEPT